MAVLTPPIHIKGEAGPSACIRYIQDPKKIIADSQTAAVLRYMQSHCIEEIASVGYNGCSGIHELAVEQFRLAEANYNASHPKRKMQSTQISVLEYLKSNRKHVLPKKLKPQAPADCTFALSFSQAMNIWQDKSQTEANLAAACDVLRAYTLTITKTEICAEHLVISVHRKDAPSPAQLQTVADEFMEHPHLKGFPALSNIHWNTDEKHIHFLISNYASNGSRKLSLSGTKLRELRRYLDKICYANGLSIIDTREARLDPEHATWIDKVKAEGKIKVWSEKETKSAKDHSRWKIDHNLKITAKEAQIDAFPAPLDAIKEDLKEIARNDLFAGDGKFIPLTVRSATQEATSHHTTTKSFKRTKQYNPANVPHQTRIYCTHIYVYDTKQHRYRQRSLLELIYILARLIITGETEFLEDNYPKRWKEFESVLISPTNVRIQNMYDSIEIINRLNIRTPAEFERRIREISQAIGALKKAISYDQHTVEHDQALYDAIQTWQRTNLSGEEREKAYAIITACKDTASTDMEELIFRYQRTQARLSENTEYLDRLRRDYSDAKRAFSVLQSIPPMLKEYTGETQKAKLHKPELLAKLRKAIDKENQQQDSQELDTRLP